MTPTVTPSDIVLASASYRGRNIASFRSFGFSSMEDIIRAVKQAVGSLSGLITLSLRNDSRGWTQSRALFIAPAAPGTQLSLF